jgi:hypothetical protein
VERKPSDAVHVDMQPKVIPKDTWTVTAQRVADPVSGLSFEFTYNKDGECRLVVLGPGVSRAIDFGHDGCVQISNAPSQ